MIFVKKNSNNGSYSATSIFGRALVEAHRHAENQSWAGTVINNSICNYLKTNGENESDFLSPYAKLYNVPYKKSTTTSQEWVMHLVEVKDTLNSEAHTNMTRNITENFANHKKGMNSRAQTILQNTLDFLTSYK